MSAKNIVTIESITQVHNALGFEKPKHPLVTVLPIDKHMADFDYSNKTFKFDFYQVSMKPGMSGAMTYGRNSYDFQEGCMVFSKPGQVMTFEAPGQIESGGWTLIFHPDLIRRSSLVKNIEHYTFFSYDTYEALHLSDDEKKNLTILVRKIEKEYQQNIDRHSQKLIVSTIELILDYCYRYYDRQFYTRTNLNKDKITKFEHVLTQYYQDKKQDAAGIPTVKYCGELLNMSPNYLSDMIKKETGQSAQQHIQEFIIERAKNLLLSTNNPITQIAYDLGFEYPQHFSKLFKNKTGLSPNSFRKN